MGLSKSTIVLLMIIVGIAGVYGVSPDFCVGKDASGHYANPENCAGFIQCPPGHPPMEMPCAPATLWRPFSYDNGICDHPYNVDCGDRPIPGQCKTGWTSFGGHCYLFVRGETKTWENSRDDCIAKGAHLVKIDDKAENDFINMNSGREMWIGLSKDSNGIFKWTDGTTPSYTNWIQGEPDNFGGHEKCVLMYRAGDGASGWDDTECCLHRTYACEKSPK